jgi:D-alanyl-D-alanine carboxypeptidase
MRTWLFASTLLLTSCDIVSGPATESGTERPAPTTINQGQLDTLITAHPMFSGSVIIARDGAFLAQAHVGFSDRLADEMNTSETFHNIASVGKMFTAVAIVQQVEAGNLAYDTAVLDLIPELEGRITSDITVDHLLHHTSGFTRMGGLDDAEIDAARTNTDFFNLVLSSDVTSDGPAGFAYRNPNYMILGEIVQRVSGMAYRDYVRANINMPAHMTGPLYVRSDTDQYDISTAYLPVDFETWWNSEDDIPGTHVDEFVHSTPPTMPSAGGGAFARASDMAAFASALRNNTLISAESFAQMCALDDAQTERGRGYARGCSVSLDDQDNRIGHTGSTAGRQARFFLYETSGIDVIVLSNHEGQAAPIFNSIDELLRDE